MEFIAEQSKIAQLKSELGEEPPARCLFCNDATSEALGERMLANNQAIGVLSGEARKVLAIAKGRYVQGGDIDLWLQGHAVDFLRIDRKGKPPLIIEKPCLSALIATQPDSLRDLGKVDFIRESGFLGRWLYVLPEAHFSPYSIESIDREVQEEYSQIILKLINLPLTKNENGEEDPHMIKFDPESFRFWRKFHDDIKNEIKQNEESLGQNFSQWLLKLPEHIARLALLIHIVKHLHEEDYPLGIITTEIGDAAEIGTILRSHAARAFRAMGQDQEDSQSQQVWSWCNKHRELLVRNRDKENLGKIEAVKPKDITQAKVAGINRVNHSKKILDRLTENGFLKKASFKSQKGKKEHLFYYLRPSAA